MNWIPLFFTTWYDPPGFEVYTVVHTVVGEMVGGEMYCLTDVLSVVKSCLHFFLSCVKWWDIGDQDGRFCFSLRSLKHLCLCSSAGQKVCEGVKRVRGGSVLHSPDNRGMCLLFCGLLSNLNWWKWLVRRGGWSCRQSEGQCDTALEENSVV